MGTAGQYQAGCNLFWVNLGWTAAPGVPLNLTAVKDLANHLYPAPTCNPGFVMTIAVESPQEDLQASKGTWRRVSPEEQERALIFKIAERLDAGCDVTEKQQWLAACRSVTMVFEVHTSDEAMYWRSVNLREALIAKYDAVARTALQRVFELQVWRHNKEAKSGKLTSAAVAEAWQQNSTLAKSSDPVTENFVDISAKIWTHMLQKESLRTVLLAAEEEFGKNNPLNAVTKLDAVMSKNKSADGLLWVLQSLFDLIRQGVASPGDFSLRALSGKGLHGGKGFTDLALYKREALHHCLALCDKHNFDASVKTELLNLDTHAKYRAKLTSNSDLQWLGLLPESGRKLVKLLEARCFALLFGMLLGGSLKPSLTSP